VRTRRQAAFGEAWRGKQQVSEEQAAGESELIHEAARRIIGGDSLRGIVTDWQCRGITTQFGKPWHNVNLRRMTDAAVAQACRHAPTQWCSVSR